MDLKLDENLKSFDISDIDKVIDHLELNKEVSVCTDFKGGENEAIKTLQKFLETKLTNYAADRNDPAKDGTSVDFNTYDRIYHLTSILEWYHLSIFTMKPWNRRHQNLEQAF